MKLMKNLCLRAGGWMGHCLTVLGLMAMALVSMANGQAVSTTTVQGTVYLANGQPGAGTLDVSWPAFTTANNQAVTAGRVTVQIAPDGFMSVNLAPNLGAMPAGLYYTAVYHMSDGTTSTEYWVVPTGAQAALGQVRAQVMPAAQAIQAVSKAYVDQSIAQTITNLVPSTGGTMTAPLILNGDPTQSLQAADKHYVDSSFGKAVPLAGGNMTGPLGTPTVNGVQAPVAGSAQATLQAAISAAGTNGAVEIPPTYAGTDGFTNPNGVYVRDLRQTSSQQFERSVKEFGAVCDGSTDDTNALQAALNYAQTHGVALTIPQGTCKTHTLTWHGESIGGLGKQVSALMGFPGQDVLATATDSVNLLSYTRLHDLTIYVDQSQDVSCSGAEGRAPAGSCAVNRLLEGNTIFSPGGNGLTGTAGVGTAWAVGNCAIAMPAVTGAGGNGLRVAEIENLEIVATGVDPMAQYTGAHSTHTCGLYLAQWPQWSEFRNIDIRGMNTGIAMPGLPGTTPTGLNADSNRWQNITIQATHGFTAAAGSNNVLDDVVVVAGNSAATAEPPTGLVLDLKSTQTGWTVRNPVILPAWNAVQPQLKVAASGGAISSVTAGPEHGLGFDPYGTQVPLKFSGSCTAQATASVNSDGSIGNVTVTQGGTGCSGTTTASVNVQGTWDTAAPVNLIGGQSVTLFGGNLLKGNGGYTVWNASGSQSNGTQLAGGGGTLPGGGSYASLVANSALGSAYQADQFAGGDFGAKLQACLGLLSAINGGTCDARNFAGNLSMGSNVTISTANATVLLPCATISTANQVVVTAGTRNVSLRGCALRGTSGASGSQGGTVLLYSGSGAMVQVGDPTYALDTPGFHLDNVAINTTAATATAKGLAAYRTQEMDLESLYFLGNSNQTGMVLDGTGNYTGGTFYDNAFTGFQSAVNAIGHQVTNPAPTDWLNASTFVRLHINCPTSGGSPVSGTYGINLQQGDGNTFTGGDVEGCDTALHLGTNAQNNTIVGLRNENSNNQVVADAGSSYNNWMTGGTMFTGQLTDNGTRNSFLDTFHRSFNGMNGDWYGSQKDATVTNHFRLGTGTGNERGLLDRYQTDYGYRWTTGLSDATTGAQYYQILDELNNVYRLSIGQYNNGQASTNNQTLMNAAGTGAVILNGSNNSGTGGVVFGSGGPSETTVATINNAGNAQFNGTLQVGGTSTFTGTTSVKNQANAEIDSILQAGSTASQKESFIYKDWNGNSQWYMVKDANNNWALNSATGGLDTFKAYQNTNSGDTYLDTSNSSGVIRLNYETGSSGKTYIYGGNSSSLIAAFSGTTAIAFPGLAAGSGHNCLQIDNSGYISNTGSGCGTESDGSTGTVNTGNTGQIAYYASNGPAVSGMAAVPVSAGGTGATTTAGALAALGAQASIAGLNGDGQSTPGIQVAGTVAAGTSVAKNSASIGPRYDVTQFGAVGNGSTDDTAAVQAAFDACWGNGTGVQPYGGIVQFPGNRTYKTTATLNAYNGCRIEGTGTGASVGGNAQAPPNIMYSGTGDGVTASITGFTEAANSVPYYPRYSPHPSSSTASPAYASIVTFTTLAANPYTVGQWVYINGFTQTAAGKFFNQFVSQVVAVTTNSFTTTIPYGNSGYGSYVDTATAVSTSVAIATDSLSRYEDSISGVQITFAGVGVFKGDRVDTGTHFQNVRLEAQGYFGIYFSGGGSSIDFDKGWRIESSGIAGLYWKGTGGFSMENGQFTTSSGYKGAGIMLDNQSCLGASHVSLRSMAFEIVSNYNAGMGGIVMLDCPSMLQPGQFTIDMVGVSLSADSGVNGHYSPTIVMSPPNDSALSLSVVNSLLMSSATNPRWVGVPALARQDMALNSSSTGGNSAYLPFLGYAPATLSDGGSSTWNVGAAPTQIIGDTILGQTWQYGVKSSTYLYSDAAFAALPNATRLYAGQILAPPAYWNGANGKRYALDVVYQTGETGSPNGGATTCETNWTATGYQIASNITTITSSAPVVIGQVLRVYFPTASYFNGVNLTVAHIYGTTFDATGLTHADVSFTSDSGGAVNAYHDYICTSAVDLSYGQSIKVGTDGAATISSIDASNPSNVLVNSGASGVGVYSTPTALSFAAPVLGPEIQFPTKSAAAPTTLAWSQGDMEQNSAAVANGICGWVNVAAGTPGTWTAIPCANATGQLNASQIVDTPSTSPECPNGVGGALTTVGCSVGSGTPTNTPAWLQYLGTGSNGAFTCTTGTCTKAPGFYNYTSYNVSVGATVNYQQFATIYVQGACTINGTVQSAVAGMVNVFSVGASGGGGGGGTAGGTAASGVGLFPAAGYSGTNGVSPGGTAGSAGGGGGGNGTALTASQTQWLGMLNSGWGAGMFWGGSAGGAGGSSGAAGGFQGTGIVLICQSITGTGTVSTNGQAGGNSTGNNIGAGGGGGAGPLILSSQASETFSGLTLTANGGAGGTCGAFTGCGTGGTGGNGPIATFSGW